MEKKNIKFAILILILVLFQLLKSNCTSVEDYSGDFHLYSGSCKSNIINLKKVQGFGDKYYIITTYIKDKSDVKKNEFLGVIKNNVITTYKGTRMNQKGLSPTGSITFKNASLYVKANLKNCIYKKND